MFPLSLVVFGLVSYLMEIPQDEYPQDEYPQM